MSSKGIFEKGIILSQCSRSDQPSLVLPDFWWLILPRNAEDKISPFFVNLGCNRAKYPMDEK